MRQLNHLQTSHRLVHVGVPTSESGEISLDTSVIEQTPETPYLRIRAKLVAKFIKQPLENQTDLQVNLEPARTSFKKKTSKS